MAVAPGTRFGRYRILSFLREGGMSEVYLARDTRLNRDVAFKLLRPGFVLDEESLSRLEHEAHAASALNHPNILTIYEVGRADSVPFIAAEFVDGVTLRERISGARMELAEVLEVMTQVARALAAAHVAGVVHRDLKPENIMLRADGYVKVLDFGMAKLAAHRVQSVSTELTAMNAETTADAAINPVRDAPGGTLGYMSPEQLRGDELDARTDIWSLGVVLYEMLTGRRPFEGMSMTDVVVAILQDEPPPLGILRDDVPLELEDIVRRALEKAHDARYQTASALSLDLARLSERLEASAVRQSPPDATASTEASGESGSSQDQLAALGAARSRLRDFGWRYRKWLLWVGAAAALAAACDLLLLRPESGERARDVGLVFVAAIFLLCYVAVRRASASPASGSPPKGVAFRGLLPFQEADRGRFYGRETDTLTLFELVAHDLFRFGVLFGESGSGKTSLLKAGLAPKLWEEGYAPIYCRSYRDPLAALAEECRRRSRVELREGEAHVDYLGRVYRELGATLVLVFDQFEEFFINFKTQSEREPLISFVAACHDARDLPAKFLFAMRSDFLYLINAEFAGRIPEPLLSTKLYHLRNFGEAEAAEIIDRSARRARLPFEEGFSRQVARDLAAGDTVLPSELQIVGERLQSRRIFNLQDYRRAGGKEQLVHGFLEDVINASGDRAGAQLILRGLISDENTRLTLTLEEIARRTQRDRETVAGILRLFAGARLVREMQDEEPWRYELMHEYLIEKINQITGKVMDHTQRANRLLRQYAANYTLDKRARVPAGELWFIRRYADTERGERERELLRKSFRRGVVRASALVLLLFAAATAAAAMLSVSEEWEGVRLSDGHTAAARQAVFSPDGRLLVSVGEDAQVIVWDFARRERLATLDGHAEIVNCVAFSPDGKWFVTGGDDQTLIVWNTARLESVKVLREHTAKVVAVAFSPDGRLLASMALDPSPSSEDGLGRTVLWDVERWEKVRELPYGEFTHANIQFTADGRRLVFVRGETWDVLTGRRVADYLDADWGGSWFSLSADERRFAAINGTGDVVMWDWRGRKLESEHHSHQDHGRAAVFSPDGRILATGAEDIILWDAATQTKIVRLEHTSIVWGLNFSPDGRWLVSTHGDGSILQWDVAERQRVANFNEHSAPVRAVAFSADGRRLASGSEDRSIIIWDAERGRKEAVLSGHKTRVTAVAFSPDGRRLASTDQDGVVALWDTEHRAAPLWTHQYLYQGKYPSANYCIAISPDGRWVVNTSGVFDSRDGRQVLDILSLEGEDMAGSIYALDFSGDGRRMVSVSDKGWSILWDAENWRRLDSLGGSKMTLVAVGLSPDGGWMVTGEDQGAVRLWGTGPLRQEGVIGQHPARVKSVAFSPDGRRVASASDDHTVALWDVRARKLAARIGTHAAPVLSVVFSPDGRRLASGEHDNSVRVYTRHRTLWGYRLD
ncbi:MAG: protein kinase [Acidobacteria bacterium]|nr:protein kinase [Acidobacteriota bacterium]